MSAAYPELERRFARIERLRGVAAVLDWDSETMMPPGGAAARSEQRATLALVCHEMLTDPALGDLLAGAEAAALEPWQAANLAAMGRDRRLATAVAPALVEAFEKATADAALVWRGARRDDDFAALAPALERVVALAREVGAARAEALGCTPYEALLDGFEPGARETEIDALFAEVEAFLPALLDRVLGRQGPPPRRPEGPFPIARQAALARRLMAVVGFDFAHGRLDVSEHPFCGGVPGDVRVTTRYDEADFTRSLMGVLHETGHAIYENGLPEAWRHQPVGRAASMALHESQSLLVEMQACRSRAFLAFAAPMMRAAFDGSGPAWEAANLHRLYTRVARGPIRVDADEVTYPLHVIVRYRLEKALIGGTLAVADLPGAWREAMRERLGIAVESDREGCLQDIHWAEGLFGYFPTYTLGALAAAQFFAAARASVDGLVGAIGEGDFAPLMGWLGAKVHALAASLPPGEIVRRATGAPLGVAAFRAHLERRYLA